jgi:hypothetical protein
LGLLGYLLDFNNGPTLSKRIKALGGVPIKYVSVGPEWEEMFEIVR